MSLKAALTACLLPALSAPAGHAQVIAYSVTAGTLGNAVPGGGGALGLDFDVNAPITVTRLGVFDSGSDGLGSALTAQLYNRDTGAAVTPLMTFAAGSGAATGTLVGGSRFLDITPLTLLAGFHGSIVASHFNNGDPEYDSAGSPKTTEATNSGGGLISFVGGGRFDPTPTPFRRASAAAPRTCTTPGRSSSPPPSRSRRAWRSPAWPPPAHSPCGGVADGKQS